jgi:hypothetical protein
MALVLFCAGCASTNTYLKPVSSCQPLSAFDTILLSPISSDSAFVEERKYGHLPPQIASAATDNLKDKLEEGRAFRRVILSSNCATRAIKLEGKIYQLIHNKGKFRIGIRGQIVNCDTGEALYKFHKEDESDSEIRKLPKQIAGHLADGITAKLVCEQSPTSNPP